MIAGAVVLAAGAGSRFAAAGGGIKLLAPWEGRPLLEAPLGALAAADLADRVVVLGSHAGEVLAGVDLGGARPLVHERWAEGMASSLRAGLEALDPSCTHALVVLGDAPRLSALAVERVLARAARDPEQTVAAAYDGVRGHPVALPRAVWERLPLRGEAGGRALGEAVLVECGDLGAPGDADTPDELA